nr:hypothetical protein [Tanacetum cinerariifolium]
MVANLSKYYASEGFNQILDFLNRSSIKYALTVNPNIYVSCIKQFWNTVVVKRVNDVTRLQALVDKKKVVVTKSAIREEKGFLRLKTPLFEGMLVDQEVDEERDADEHVEEVTAGDDDHGDDSAAHEEVPTVQQTPPQLPQVQPPSPQPQPQPQQAADFPMSLLQEALDAYVALTRRVEHLEYDKVAQALEITKLKRRVKKLEKRNKVRVLKLRRLQRVGTSQRVDTSDDIVMDDESNQGRMIAEMDKDDVVVLMDDKEDDKKVEEAKGRMIAEMDKDDAIVLMEDKNLEETKVDEILSMHEDETEPAEVQEVVDVVTTAKLITEVVTAASIIIPTAKTQVPAAILTATPLKAKEDPAVKRYQATKRKPHTEAQARNNMMMYLKNVAGFKLDYFKGMSYDDIRLIFEAKFNSDVDFLLKTKEQMEEEENKALQTTNETPAEKSAKRRKLNEEVEELKRHL